jgi:hypothetical protein
VGSTDYWKRIHKKKNNDLIFSPNIILVILSRRIRWVGNVARMRERRVVYRLLVGKREGKRLLGRETQA